MGQRGDTEQHVSEVQRLHPQRRRGLSDQPVWEGDCGLALGGYKQDSPVCSLGLRAATPAVLPVLPVRVLFPPSWNLPVVAVLGAASPSSSCCVPSGASRISRHLPCQPPQVSMCPKVRG